MAKKVIRLTESDLTKIVRKVIEEQNAGKKIFACDRQGTLKGCLTKNGLKGSPMFNVNGPTQLFSVLYVVQPGDTWNGIMNKVLGLDNFYGIDANGNLKDKKERIANYERYSKINLDMNPKLGGNKSAIKAGDILHLEGPYD